MIENNLFEEVLINPLNKGANKLYIVSGFASSAMAFNHLITAKEIHKELQVKLIIGMCPLSGISLTNHRGFQNLMEKEFSENFECSYLTKKPSIHSKAYAWYNDNIPIAGYLGSANYTQTAFKKDQRELLEYCDPKELFSYFDSITNDTIYCNHPESEQYVRIYNEINYQKGLPSLNTNQVVEIPENINLTHITIPLVTKYGEVQKTAGLNWGFRQTGNYNRNKNEAYIQLRPEVYRSDFFPRRSIHFTILTDDNIPIICTRAQKDEQGHAIETPQNNSLLGEYFRFRLGLPNGAFITTNDLDNYGRRDIDFYKLDSETYFMDFSV